MPEESRLVSYQSRRPPPGKLPRFSSTMIPIRPSAALTVNGYPQVSCAPRLMCTNFYFIFWVLKFYVFSNLTAPVIDPTT